MTNPSSEGVSKDVMSTIAPALQTALTKRGYETLTPVQKAVIAPEFLGVDMLVSAQTGSGKTVAFGLAMEAEILEGREHLARADRPLALIIAPTRELALQVARELEWLYAPAGGRIATCVGGMDMRGERQALGRGAHIVVGTPGRLKDHIDRRSLDLSELAVAVLDEADEMLNMGFSEDLEYILSASPKTRRTLMFSATVPGGIARLAKKYQRDAVRINTASEANQHVDITYRALTVSSKDRQNAIVNVLRYYEAQNAIVFCQTRAAVNHMTARFNNRGFAVVALSGELSQSQRTHALQAMRDGRARVCIATDVAARGIDLPNLELVIHADLPKNPEILLHRSGRTGRAGRKGTCILITPHAAQRRTERLLRDAKIKAEWAGPPSAEDVRKRDNERLLADPIFAETPDEAEAAFATQLLELYSAEQIAAAFVRSRRKDRSAPEELRGGSDAGHGGGKHGGGSGPRERREPRAKREDFSDGVWYELSVGREHNAEPRWLLPMLFKAGDLERGEVGAIKITQNVSYIEIDPKGVERFEKAIGEKGELEKNTHAKRLPSKPPAAERGAGGGGGPRSGGPRGGGGYDRGERSGGRSGGRPDSRRDGGKRDYAKKSSHKRYEKPEYDPAFDDRPPAKVSEPAKTPRKVEGFEVTPIDDDPFMNNSFDGKKPKKPHKKKLARAAARAAKEGRGPSAPKSGGSKAGASKERAAPSTGGGGKAKAKPAANRPRSKLSRAQRTAGGGDAKLMRRKRK
ncbi:MAG: DEAD/DEAH box helicase [Robiginitomaculum sp.]